MARKTKEQALQTREKIINAARGVFFQNGVSRSSLNAVARAASMTRGAIYWHFKDKEELFLAVQMNSLNSVVEDMKSAYRLKRYADPLERIEALLCRFFEIVNEDLDVRMVIETIVLRHEESSGPIDTPLTSHEEVERCLAKLESTYNEAASLGMLLPELEPKLITLDTWAFAYGLLYGQLSRINWFTSRYRDLISSHIALRRRP